VTISSISTTIERAKAVAFANPNGALEITIFGPESVNVKTPQDLVGKRIGLTRATLEEVVVPKMAPPGANIMWFDEISATIQAMLTGQVDVISMSGFAEKAVKDANPAKKIERKMVVTTAYYAPIVRKNDFELLNFINTWVFVNTHNGVLGQIYKQHTGLDLPPLPVH
jgi:polar amino acid transport system substrate-binding protein